ncbi:MAG: hypothetical protein ACRCX2_20140 [Paraclostridium sp.]
MRDITLNTFLDYEEEYNFIPFYEEHNFTEEEITSFENILVDCGFQLSTNKFDEEHFIFDDYENNPYSLEDLLNIWIDNEYVNFKELFSDKIETIRKKLSI